MLFQTVVWKMFGAIPQNVWSVWWGPLHRNLIQNSELSVASGLGNATCGCSDNAWAAILSRRGTIRFVLWENETINRVRFKNEKSNFQLLSLLDSDVVTHFSELSTRKLHRGPHAAHWIVTEIQKKRKMKQRWVVAVKSTCRIFNGFGGVHLIPSGMYCKGCW